jgi:hypothetical protein
MAEMISLVTLREHLDQPARRGAEGDENKGGSMHPADDLGPLENFQLLVPGFFRHDYSFRPDRSREGNNFFFVQ